ncbi:ATP phosphoribosyltransferase regulatory subunit [Hazenella coriacea]|uniref:ATP phosphoribosyltransferase regulatory subunit n=1 Tax=Hazenella coriacea TaxID=1179467 RepID=A0A4R3LBL0_9BACL|nr:ATP phosphoribosyltransferase regulatory subunit [Hazenella coriacea]TCS95694.1 ATP phosphoribosyltransferase regulatory subunit [Hazenella coriacea]
MTKPRTFEKPTGFRDFPPLLVRKKRMIQELVQIQFERWGYQEVYTPSLEFYDTVGFASAIEESKMFKLIDREGSTLVLRPDQTAPIARLAASVLKDEPLPLRLFYHANVFRSQEFEAGRNAEFFQSGVELIGDSHAEADAEVIALAVEALRACQIPHFKIALGHVSLLDALLREHLPDETWISLLKEDLGNRDVVQFCQRLDQFQLDEGSKKVLHSLLRPKQDWKSMEAFKRSKSPEVQEALQQLEEIWHCLDDGEVTPFLSIDLCLVGRLHYYTGVYFEGFADQQGFPLLSGGRYDHLMDFFGRPLPATGFALKMDPLLESSPLNPKDKERTLLLYDLLQRKEAIHMAQQLREQGQIVMMCSVHDTSVGFSQRDGVCVVDLTQGGQECR